jgi:hypothetical protein
MRTTPRTEDEAVRASTRSLLPAGWHDGRITEAVEGISPRNNPTMRLTVAVVDDEGVERTLQDVLSDTPLGAAKLRHACEAVGTLPGYQAGKISQDDFPGHDVQVKLAIEKRRGFAPRNIIEDYRAGSSTPAVPLRVASGPGGRT